MRFTSSHRGARISPTKVRPVLSQIRGQSASQALITLQMSKRRGAVMLKAILKAAIANAENQKEISEDRLFVSEARADKGPTMKRWQPKDRGRAHPIKKRTSHILISVDVK